MYGGKAETFGGARVAKGADGTSFAVSRSLGARERESD
jgi:hypothetical protein